MKLGSLVVYGWKYEEDQYYSKPEKFGIIIGEKMSSNEVLTECLVKDSNNKNHQKWDVELEECRESVSVMWDNGAVEECSIENLFEVGTCETGI